MSRPARNRFRRLALALATAQIAVYAALPFAEARLEQAPGPVTVESRHSTDCAPVHNPAACLFCQVTLVRAQPGGHAAVPAAADTRATHESAPGDAARPAAPPGIPHSRAPPTLLA